MKDLPLKAPLMNIPAGMWPLITGVGAGVGGLVGALGYAYGALVERREKMTKFEKAALAFVAVLIEKFDEMEKQRRDLTSRLTETESKLVEETKRADQAEGRAERAQAQLREVMAQITTLEASITALEGKLADVRQDKRRKGRHAEAAKL
jgi:chromosome segregation ATPase